MRFAIGMPAVAGLVVAPVATFLAAIFLTRLHFAVATRMGAVVQFLWFRYISFYLHGRLPVKVLAEISRQHATESPMPVGFNGIVKNLYAKSA